MLHINGYLIIYEHSGNEDLAANLSELVPNFLWLTTS